MIWVVGRKIQTGLFVFVSDLESKKNLNQDQVVFYLIKGSLVKDLAGRALGPLSHSRWLTLGQRVLCHLCKKLVTLAKLVVRAYGSV